jgi:hypothetical protein
LHSGEKFARLTLIERSKLDKDWWWLCSCDCGNTKFIREYAVREGITRSCGCLLTEAKRRARKHGECRGDGKTIVRSAEYKTWLHIRDRCSNPKAAGYELYGGRGIKVCERRQASYLDFLEDMGRKPTPKHSIDRIDNQKGYEPENCRWATTTEQRRNCRTNRFLNIDGIAKTVSEWAELSGTHYETIRGRLARGWAEKEAVFTHARKRKELL